MTSGTNATKSNKERKLFGIKQLQRYLEPRHPSSLHFLKWLGALKSLHYILCSQRKCDALHKKHVQQANGSAKMAKTNHFRPIDPLADSSQKSATKRSVLYHPLGTKEHSKTARVRNAATPASKDLLRHNSLPCLSGKSRAQAKRHLA